VTAPTQAIGGRLTRTLLALIDVHRRDGRALLRTVAERSGLSRWQTYEALGRLRDLGLVGWEHGTLGTLRPLYWPTDTTLLADTVEHIVCCHDVTLALCGATTDGTLDGDADCVVCLDLAVDLRVCPLGPGACQLAERPKENR
jgi:hypothetical protein